MCKVVRGFELGRGEVSNLGVDAPRVEPFDVEQSGELELFGGAPRSLTPHELGLVEPVDRLGHRVIVRISDGSDRWSRADLDEAVGEPDRGVSTPGVGVGDQLVEERVTTPHRLLQGGHHQVGPHRGREVPTDDHPAVHVDHERDLDHPRPRRHVGEVHHPEPVRGRSGEVTLHEVRCAHMAGVGSSGEHFPAADRATVA